MRRMGKILKIQPKRKRSGQKVLRRKNDSLNKKSNHIDKSDVIDCDSDWSIRTFIIGIIYHIYTNLCIFKL